MMRNIDNQALHLAYKYETDFNRDHDLKDYIGWLEEKVTAQLNYKHRLNMAEKFCKWIGITGTRYHLTDKKK